MTQADSALLDRIRSDFAPLPAGTLYLDHAATAPIPEIVRQALLTQEQAGRANVGRSQHSLAERSEQAYEGARTRIARHLGCRADQVVFTAGATQAINMVALGLEEAIAPGDEIVLTQAEHHSNLLPWGRLARRRGAVIKILPVTRDGRLDLSVLPSLLGPRCRVLAVTHASNVSGAINDVSVLAAAAHAVGALCLVDGAQAMPHLPVRFDQTGADFYAFSGHKSFGPSGVGVLVGRQDALARLDPALVGGGMVWDIEDGVPRWRDPPHGLEAGTPPIAAAIGLAAALDWLNGYDRAVLRACEKSLSIKALEILSQVPGLRLLGPLTQKDRLPLFSFTLQDCHPHDVLHLLAQRGMCLRGGNLCASSMLEALGAEQCLRASLCFLNDEAELDELGDALRLARQVLA